MQAAHFLNNQKAFTLIEVLGVLIIAGVLASVAATKYETLSEAAVVTALKFGNRELNVRESLAWTKIKLSDDGWSNDQDVFNNVDKNLGKEYTWGPGPTIAGGTLHYQKLEMKLNRSESTNMAIGSWN